MLRTAARVLFHFIRDNAWPTIPLAIYKSPAGSLLVAGEERWTRYYLDRFHGETWSKVDLGTHRAWKIPALLRLHGKQADLVIARLDLITINLAGPSTGIRVPEWIRMKASVSASTHLLKSRSAKEDLRAIRNKGLSWRISHDPEELLRHLDRDYYPYTRLRHGEDAFVQPKKMLQKIYNRGGLLIVERDSIPVAGMMFEIKKDTLQMWTIACANSDESLLSIRAVAAVYAFSFDYARQKNLAYVDFRGCRPCLNDSLFFVKQKWGGRVHGHGEVAFEFAIQWDALSRSVLQFFESSPLIFRKQKGFAAIGTDEFRTRTRWQDTGLNGFHVVS